MDSSTIVKVNQALDNPSMVTKRLSKIARDSPHARFMPQFPGLLRCGVDALRDAFPSGLNGKDRSTIKDHIRFFEGTLSGTICGCIG